MHECRECRLMSRRNFLTRAGAGLGTLALADPLLRSVATTYAQTPGGSGNVLVLCQLSGGLDVLSVLAPLGNSVYQDKRPTLALPASAVTPLPDSPDYGLTNLMPFMSELYARRQLAIVQQVGYPDANGSHFESQEIFEYGVRNLASGTGTAASWYERLRRTYFDEPYGVMDTEIMGDPRRYGYPDETYRGAAQQAFGRLAQLKRGRTQQERATLDSYNRINNLGVQLRARTEGFESTGEARGDFYRAATLASAGLGTRILKLGYGGFDTHSGQAGAMEGLLPGLDAELRQFVDDLQALGLWERTCLCFYTEFGRRNAENGSPGTDHGHGSHIFLVGPHVNGGLHGQSVTTDDLNQDSLPYYVDFRAPFSTCIRDWLGFDPQPIFAIDGETYDENVGSSLFA